MRLPLGVAGVLAVAGALGACAAISGLGKYSSGDCPADGCDASMPPMGEEAPAEAAVVPPGMDAPTGREDADDGFPEDSEPEAGCEQGFLACEGGCIDPSSPSTCGGCSNACGADAALCAGGGDAGSY